MSAALYAYYDRPETVGIGNPYVAPASRPWVAPVVPVVAPGLDPTRGMGLIVATVKAIGPTSKSAIVTRSGLAPNAVAILLPAAVDLGFLTFEKRGLRHIYRVAPRS